MADFKKPHRVDASLNLTAELAGRVLAKQKPSLDRRPSIEGFAIDNVEPNELTDRDDAVSIEYRTDPKLGKLTILHVSIADVASRVPKSCVRESDPRLMALDKVAIQKRETQYFRHGTLPMFPRKLQDQMSLENKQLRPAMTISMTYDQDCQLIHTEFSRRRLRTQCKSYEQATHEIHHPTPDSPDMHNIAMLAKNLLVRKPGEVRLPYYDEETGTYYDSEGNPQHLSGDASSSYLAVQGCMVAANEATAKLMSKSNFLFRNHFGGGRDIDLGQAIKGSDVQLPEDSHLVARQQAWLQSFSNAAEYGVECLGHQGLKSEAYCHVTSPIRRYSDVANQRMMHWAIDVMDAITEETMRSYWKYARSPDKQGGDASKIPHLHHDQPNTSRTDPMEASVYESPVGRRGSSKIKRVREDALHYALWEHANEILGAVTALHEVGSQSQRMEAETQMINQLRDVLTPICGQGNMVIYHAIRKSMARVKSIELPYRKQELADVAQQINTCPLEMLQRRSEVVHGTLDTLFHPQTTDPDKPNYVPSIENMHAAIRGRRPCRFAELLEAAATRGEINDFFVEETIRRLHSEDDGAELMRNLNTLMTIAERHGDKRWDVLRREAFQMIKTDSMLANRTFSDLRKRHDPPRVLILETSLLDEEHVSHPTALVVLSHEGVDYSAPVVDTADNPAEARQGAILTFYRNYGDLSPHDEQYTPKLIDLALSRARNRKGERLSILKKMCGKDFTVEQEVTPFADMPGNHLVLRVTDNKTGDSIEKTRDGIYESPESYLDKLAMQIIEDRRFVDMIATHDLAFGQMAERKESASPSLMIRKPIIEEQRDKSPGIEPFS